MYAEKIQSKITNKTYYRPVLQAGESPFMGDMDITGFCLGCGNDCLGIEPDATKRRCDNCGEFLVYGIEQLVMLDIVRYEGSAPDCPACAGTGTSLGILGDLEYFRCRQCGVDFSRKA